MTDDIMRATMSKFVKDKKEHPDGKVLHVRVAAKFTRCAGREPLGAWMWDVVRHSSCVPRVSVSACRARPVGTLKTGPSETMHHEVCGPGLEQVAEC